MGWGIIESESIRILREITRDSGLLSEHPQIRALFDMQSRRGFGGKGWADFSGIDLSGMDFSGISASKFSLSGAILAGADLSGVDFSDAAMPGVDLSGATLRNGRLEEMDLSGADLLGATLTDARLEDIRLPEANLSKSDCSGASFYHCDLDDGDLSEANLSGALVNLLKAASLVRISIGLTSRARISPAPTSRGSISPSSVWTVPRAVEECEPNRWLEQDALGYARTPSGGEVDFAPISVPTPAGTQLTTPVESKWVAQAWRREARAMEALYQGGIMATKTVLDLTRQVWAIPAPLLALLLG